MAEGAGGARRGAPAGGKEVEGGPRLPPLRTCRQEDAGGPQLLAVSHQTSAINQRPIVEDRHVRGQARRVMISVRIENLCDLYRASREALPGQPLRAVNVPDAYLCVRGCPLALPPRLIGQLGLEPVRTISGQGRGGEVALTLYGPVRLSVAARTCTCDVIELPEDGPVMIGRLAQRALGLLEDPALT